MKQSLPAQVPAKFSDTSYGSRNFEPSLVQGQKVLPEATTVEIVDCITSSASLSWAHTCKAL